MNDGRMIAGRGPAAAELGAPAGLMIGDVERIAGDPRSGALALCDHASSAIPPELSGLGLPASELARHIAYDIGAAWLTRRLAARLGCPALLSSFSRLLIDPNRGLDDPTLVMRLSDGAIIPGNARLDAAGEAERVARYYRPYDEAIAASVAGAVAAGHPPALISIHSFTPSWKGRERPWHVGLLWDRDGRVALPLLAALRQLDGVVVGDNEPYRGGLPGDVIDRHATRIGLPNVLVELRQDLIDTPEKAARWADILARPLAPILAGLAQAAAPTPLPMRAARA